jgi:ABC-type nitrate/sulfonate/bicarbonate transport system substrate-binding protein
MLKNARPGFFFLLIASFFFAGCSSPTPQSYPPLKVEWTDWDGDYTLLVAQEQGFFEKFGVEVEPVYYADFGNSTPDLASHKLDAGLFSIQDMLTASRVTALKMVAVYDSGGKVAGISRAPDVIVFRADVIADRPDDVRAFLNAWFEAVAFRHANPQESQKIIASITQKPLSEIARNPDLKLFNREDNLKYFSQDPTRQDTIYAVANTHLAFEINRGDLTFLPGLEEIIDPSFLKPFSADAVK